jgi:uncharacterized Zn-finger protein
MRRNTPNNYAQMAKRSFCVPDARLYRESAKPRPLSGFCFAFPHPQSRSAMSDQRPSATSPYATVQWQRQDSSSAYPAQYSQSAYGVAPAHASSGSPAYNVPYAYNSQQPATMQAVVPQQGYPMTPTSRSHAYPSPQMSTLSTSQPIPYASSHAGTSSPTNARNAYSHSRSYSASQGYGAPAAYAYDDRGMASSPGMSTSPPDQQYPASPQRPFGCDMCPLSFSRQHDLKRHRETHSGEKPFLCNGVGCGKTFTRKDALKRHQVSNNLTSDIVSKFDACT